MLTTWLVLRFVKWLGIALFGGGLAVALASREPRTRFLGGLGLGTIGLLVTWMAGYGLLKIAGGHIWDTHVLGAILGSLAALAGGALGGLLRNRVVPTALVVGGLTAAIGVMTARTDPTAQLVLGAVLPAAIAAVAALLAGLLLPAHNTDADVSKHAVTRWFAWVARAEGTSLLVLLFVFMPLKYGADIEIDGGQGWVGWAHGGLLFVYLLALGGAVAVARWGVLAAIVGFIASTVPFGTFAFEWWMARRDRARAEAAAG